MITSGLVVVLQPDLSKVESALASIRLQPEFTVGEQNGQCLSVALEATNLQETQRWHDWLSRLPGIDGVRVVFVHRDDPEETHVGD